METKKWITVLEFAKKAGIGKNQAYDLIKRGEVPAVRAGRRLIVPDDALDRMLEAQQTT